MRLEFFKRIFGCLRSLLVRLMFWGRRALHKRQGPAGGRFYNVLRIAVHRHTYRAAVPGI